MYLGITWGDLVGIRPVWPTDAMVLRRLAVDPEMADLLYEDLGGPIPSTPTLATAFLLDWLQARPDWAIINRERRVIGSVRLWRISERNRSAMLTIFIGPREHWGRGYGTDALRLALHQAFGAMNLRRVELHVFDFNQRAIASYEKVGFHREGARRQALSRHGRYQDILIMGILKDEFLAAEAERKSAGR